MVSGVRCARTFTGCVRERGQASCAISSSRGGALCAVGATRDEIVLPVVIVALWWIVNENTCVIACIEVLSVEVTSTNAADNREGTVTRGALGQGATSSAILGTISANTC